MDYGLFHFLNLEFWFCFFYSLVGGKCAPVEPLGGSVELGSASISAHATSTGFAGGFFSYFFETGSGALQAVSGFFLTAWTLYSGFAYSVSGMLAFSIVSSVLGVLFLRYRELSKYGVLPPEAADAHPLRTRWNKLLAGAMSSDPREWRESILEADIMLGDLLGKFGYQGETTADKMRVIPEDAFITLPAAWEAHRVRNFVSQRASDFILTQREAFRVMKLYEQVFEEFKYV